MWQKLSDHLGAETVGKIRSAIDKLTGIWTFLVEVQRDGIRAISRFLAGQLSGLWDSLLGMAKSFLMDRVITVGTTKLLSLLDPTGIMAVVNSFAAFFNAVRSAFEYFNDILQIVAGYVNTLAAVAQGNIGPGAAMLEQGLAASIPVAIGFLAAQVGLGNVPEKIVELIEQLRVLVDKGIDWLIQKAIALGKAALKALGLGPKEEAGGEHDARLKAATADVHVLMEAKGAKVDDVKLQLPQIKERYQLTTLVLVSDGEYTYRPHAVINPQFDGPPGVLFTPEQLAELAKVAETWIAHIKKKRQNAQFHANPEAYIRGVPEKQKPGQVTTGQAVEAAAAPQIIALAAEAGLTVVKNIHLQAKGAKDKNGKVTTVGGTQAELDFAIFGSQGVQEVISAKLSPQAVDLGKYRSKLKLYYSCPDDIAGGLVSWLKTNCGDSGAWPDAVRMDVVSSGGTMSIQKFRATFLSKVPVDRIVISSVTPGPEHAAGLQLRATAPELISHMIALITPRV
jgi:hypothetical protein